MDVRKLVTVLGYRVDRKGIDRADALLRKSVSKAMGIAKTGSIALAAGILGIGAASVKAAADMEIIATSFEVMLGDAEKAKNLLAEIDALSLETPFDPKDLADSAKTMLNFGVASKDVLNNLKMLGDVAGADKVKMESLTLAFSQVASGQKLTGQDLLQFINAGFNPLKVLADKTGVAYSKLKDDMSKGLISAADVSDAFKTATGPGGTFYKNMIKQSETLIGRWSTFAGFINKVRQIIGNWINPALKEMLRISSELLKEKVIPWLDAAMKQAPKFLDIMSDVWLILKQIPGVLGDMQDAFQPQIDLAKELVSTIWDLVAAVFGAVGAFSASEDGLSTISFLVDGLTMAIKGWVAILKTAAAGFKMIGALVTGDTDEIANIDDKLKTDLADLFGDSGSTEDRLNAFKDKTNGRSATTSAALAARQALRIQNVNINQTNNIKAPAAKDGTTGLSADGIAKITQDSSRSVFAMELKRLTLSSMGS